MTTGLATDAPRAAEHSGEDRIDRLTPQTRPAAPVIGLQRWHSMLFLHWALPPKALRRHVPARLAVDTFGGEAYVTMALFTVVGARLRPLPPLPGLSTFHEVSVRTYVHLDGQAPGLWFFSLDASNLLACGLARAALRLPCFFSRMRREQLRDEHHFTSRRVGLRGRRAEVDATWRSTGPLLEAQSGSREHFLTQRFFLYSNGAMGRLWRQQVHHAPWPLFSAERVELRQTLDEVLELPFLPRSSLAHASPGVDVELFPPHLV